MPDTDTSPRHLSQRRARLTNTHSSPTDQELVKAAKCGHLDSFDALFERHSQNLFRAACRITRNREDAEDAVQAALLSAFVHFAKFDGRSAIATWLTRITMNSALMLLRKRRAVPVALSEESWLAEGVDVLDSRSSPEDTYAREEQKWILGEALRNLPSRLREAIELRDLRGLTTEDISKRMGITASAVKARVFRGRAKLFDRMRCHTARARSQWNRAGTACCLRIPREEHL